MSLIPMPDLAVKRAQAAQRIAVLRRRSMAARARLESRCRLIPLTSASVLTTHQRSTAP